MASRNYGDDVVGNSCMSTEYHRDKRTRVSSISSADLDDDHVIYTRTQSLISSPDRNSADDDVDDDSEYAQTHEQSRRSSVRSIGDDDDGNAVISDVEDVTEGTSQSKHPWAQHRGLSSEGNTTNYLSPILSNLAQPDESTSVDGLPCNWARGANGNYSTSPSRRFTVVTLDEYDPEFKVIQQECGNVNIRVLRVGRIQNPRMFKKFMTEVNDVIHDKPSGFDVNVRYLYHGTVADQHRLFEEGLDQRLSRQGYFGKGLYFSDTPLKCIHYADDAGAGRSNPDEAYLLKCRVILGDMKFYSDGKRDISLNREPVKQELPDGSRMYFDSVVGCPKDFREYVVYGGRRVLLEYIVWFKVDRNFMKQLRTKAMKGGQTVASNEHAETAGANETNMYQGQTRPAFCMQEHEARMRYVREVVRRKRMAAKGKTYTPASQEQLRHDDELAARIRHILCDAGAQTSSQNEAGEVEKDAEQRKRHDDKGINSLITEFLHVLSIDDVSIARHYLLDTKLNLNRAISRYLDDAFSNRLPKL